MYVERMQTIGGPYLPASGARSASLSKEHATEQAIDADLERHDKKEQEHEFLRKKRERERRAAETEATEMVDNQGIDLTV